MEKLIIGVSLETLFELESLYRTKDFTEKEGSLFAKGPLFNFMKLLNQINTQQSEFLIEIVIVSDHSPILSTALFHALDYYQLDVSQVILTGLSDISSYLEALEVELYFSTLPHLIHMAQRCKILAGYMMLNQKNDCYRFAFDHRLFADEGGYSALGKWIPLLGFIQRIYQSVQVGMITTRCYSLELWVKELFKMAQCRMDEMCFVVHGGGAEVAKLFNFSIYFEGTPREFLSIASPPPCLLNIDF